MSYLVFPHKYAWGWVIDIDTLRTYSHTYDHILGAVIRLPDINMMVGGAEDAEDLALTMELAEAAREGKKRNAAG